MYFNFRKQKMLLRTKKNFLSSILQTHSIIIKSCQRQNSIQLKYPPLFQIEKLTKQNLLESPSIMNIVHDLTAQTYLHPSSLIDKFMEQASHIYLARIKDRFIGYMVVDFEFGLSVYNKEPIIHSIIACTDFRWKKQGIHRLIHGYFIREVQQYQKQTSTKSLVCFTTATPFIMRLIPDFYIDIQPAYDERGSYDPKYVPVIEQIQSKMHWQLDDERNRNKNKHPFIQYGILKNVFYTNEELERIEQVKSNPKYLYNLFDRYQLNIEKGDRILYLLRVTDKKIEFLPNLHKNI